MFRNLLSWWNDWECHHPTCRAKERELARVRGRLLVLRNERRDLADQLREILTKLESGVDDP